MYSYSCNQCIVLMVYYEITTTVHYTLFVSNYHNNIPSSRSDIIFITTIHCRSTSNLYKVLLVRSGHVRTFDRNTNTGISTLIQNSKTEIFSEIRTHAPWPQLYNIFIALKGWDLVIEVRPILRREVLNVSETFDIIELLWWYARLRPAV